MHFPELENCSIESGNHKQEGKVGHVHKNPGLDVRYSIFQSSSIFYLNSAIAHTQFIKYVVPDARLVLETPILQISKKGALLGSFVC